IQFSRFNAAQRRRKFLLISITFPLPCAAAAVSVAPVYPAGYGQPAAVNCPVRFSALPVPSYLSSFLFHWPLPLLPASHSPPPGHVLLPCAVSTDRRSSPSAGTTFSAWRGLPLFSFRRSAG